MKVIYRLGALVSNTKTHNTSYVEPKDLPEEVKQGIHAFGKYHASYVNNVIPSSRRCFYLHDPFCILENGEFKILPQEPIVRSYDPQTYSLIYETKETLPFSKKKMDLFLQDWKSMSGDTWMEGPILLGVIDYNNKYTDRMIKYSEYIRSQDVWLQASIEKCPTEYLEHVMNEAELNIPKLPDNKDWKKSYEIYPLEIVVDEYTFLLHL